SGDLQDSRHLSKHIGQQVCLAGLLATGRHALTSRGDTMQFITLEDEWGLFETTLFPGTCAPVNCVGLGPYLVEGKVEEDCGVVAITATRLSRFEGGQGKG